MQITSSKLIWFKKSGYFWQQDFADLEEMRNDFFWEITGPSMKFGSIPLHTIMFGRPTNLFPCRTHQNSVHQLFLDPLSAFEMQYHLSFEKMIFL